MHAQIDSINDDDHEIENHVRGSSRFAGMIAENVEVTDQTRHGRDESHAQSEQHRVERIAHEIRHRREGKTGQVDQKAEKQKSDREMDQHRMDRMPKWFAFEEIFQLLDLTPVGDWRLRLARSRAIHLSTSVRR